jgi:hypothetical protein
MYSHSSGTLVSLFWVTNFETLLYIFQEQPYIYDVQSCTHVKDRYEVCVCVERWSFDTVSIQMLRSTAIDDPLITNPSIRNRSRTSIRWGDVKTPVRIPHSLKIASQNMHVEPWQWQSNPLTKRGKCKINMNIRITFLSC